VKTCVSKLEFETVNSATLHCVKPALEEIVTMRKSQKPIASWIFGAAFAR
jgi:hypothetical protein